jgi:hypothetical protein
MNNLHESEKVFKLAPQLEVFKMGKKTMTKEYVEDLEDDFDYSEESSDDNMLDSMMENLVETDHHQIMMAIELTKVALSKNSDSNMSEDTIFNIFKKALQVINDNSPLKNLLEKA